MYTCACKPMESKSELSAFCLRHSFSRALSLQTLASHINWLEASLLKSQDYQSTAKNHIYYISRKSESQ